MEETHRSGQKNCVVLVNPVSKQKRPKQLQVLLQEIDERALDWSVVVAPPKGLTETARTLAAEGVRRLIIYGGDGSVNAMAHALAGSGVELGILPSGTGNDFARALGIPTDIRQALDILQSAVSRPVDLGQCNGQYFINVAGIGFDAEVVSNARRFKRFASSRKAAYFLSVFYTLLRMKSYRATIFFDGENEGVERRLLLGAVGNGRYIGGGMCVAPKAEIDDGMLDVCLVKKIGRLHFLRLFPLFIRGDHIAHTDVVEYRRVRSIAIHFEQKLPLQMDGELCSATKLEASVVSGALRLLFPVAEEDASGGHSFPPKGGFAL